MTLLPIEKEQNRLRRQSIQSVLKILKNKKITLDIKYEVIGLIETQYGQSQILDNGMRRITITYQKPQKRSKI